MRSVKGMTIGSPEFVATVKEAERRDEISELIAGMHRNIDRIMNMGDSLTGTQDYDIRCVRDAIIEVVNIW